MLRPGFFYISLTKEQKRRKIMESSNTDLQKDNLPEEEMAGKVVTTLTFGATVTCTDGNLFTNFDLKKKSGSYEMLHQRRIKNTQQQDTSGLA